MGFQEDVSSRHTSPGALLIPGHPQQQHLSPALTHKCQKSEPAQSFTWKVDTGSWKSCSLLSYTVMCRAKLQSSKHTSRAPMCSLGAYCMVTNGCATCGAGEPNLQLQFSKPPVGDHSRTTPGVSTQPVRTGNFSWHLFEEAWKEKAWPSFHGYWISAHCPWCWLYFMLGW